jgi:RimJ/RimL family protein N-acetyltransferase
MLRLANADDIAAIMEIERQPGFEDFVGRSSAEFHARALTDPDYAYLVGEDGIGTIAGFAILRDLANPMGNIYLKRIAVRTPGSGFGQPFLSSVIDWVFSETSNHRFWLDHFVTNHRARHVYERCGMIHEGIYREAYQFPDGGRADLGVMSILRHEWAEHDSLRQSG